ncbi:MAG: V-type ATP synthase subunit I [Candidatus Metalachnospira sp.]|nr:V-type ATP synthase subunit I [Candidatus Metalachnospira sp.]
MAIVEMSKLSVICLNSQKKRFIKELMDLGVVEINKPSGNSLDNPIPEGTFIANNSAEVSHLDAQIAAFGAALETLDSYDQGKKTLFKTRKEVTVDDFIKEVDVNQDSAKHISEEASALVKRVAEAKNEINRLALLIKGLEPWKELDLPLNETGTKTSAVFMGVVPVKTNYDVLLNSVLEEAPSAVVQKVSSDKTQTYLCLICLKDEKSKVLESLKQFSFTSVSLSENNGTAEEAIQAYEKKIAALKDEISANEDRLKELAKHKEKIEYAYDDLLLKRDRAKAIGDMINTKKVFCFDGWIPTGSSENVKKLLDKHECYYEISEPIKNEETPILLKNNKFASPFEAVTEMYSMPLATEVDPTPIMAPFYFLFFGLMLSDAAYGIILSVACFALSKKFKFEGTMKKMITMFFWCGISTFFWGVLFGGWFGDALTVFSTTFLGREITINPVWIDPLKEPMTLLIFSLILGAIHMFVGMGMQAYMLIKDKKPWDALFDIGLWYLLLIGLVLFGVGSMMTPALSSIGKWMAIIGAVGIIVTGGRNKKGFGKITGGFGSLYGITSYLSDVLSYSRLLALGLATGVVAKVVNILGSLAGSGIVGIIVFIAVFLFGTVFNLAINALGAYVHSCRLQYVEFFGKFYSGGGRAFSPLSGKTKFFKIINKEDK